MNLNSTLLFANPSFLKGIARIFDVTCALDQYNDSPTDRIADLRALKSDWRAVGDDLKAAMTAVQKEMPPEAEDVQR